MIFPTSRLLSLFRFQTYSSSRQIRNALLWRMIAASVLLASVAGAGSYFLEMKNVDTTVRTLAIRQANTTMARSLTLIENPTTLNLRSLNEVLHRELKPGNFVLIEIYTSDKREVAAAALPGMDLLDQEVAMHSKKHLQQGQINFRNFSFEDQHYVQVFTPLDQSNGKNIGFFEGVYKVPQEQWEQIMSRVNSAALFVIIAVFATVALLYPIILSLIRELVTYSTGLAEANIGMLVAMGAAIAKRDNDTDAHNFRVTILAVMLAEKIGLPADQMRILIVGSFLHDVGKIAIPDAILMKPGPLNEEERKIIQTHVTHGLDVIQEHTWLAQALQVVHEHHERVDGTGYPQGLVGTQISLVARIFALADVFDALASHRPYKDPYSLDQCIEILEEGRGTHFDADLVDPFIQVATQFMDTIELEDITPLRGMLTSYINTYFQVSFNCDRCSTHRHLFQAFFNLFESGIA